MYPEIQILGVFAALQSLPFPPPGQGLPEVVKEEAYLKKLVVAEPVEPAFSNSV